MSGSAKISAETEVLVTFFDDWGAHAKVEQVWRLGDLAEKIQRTNRNGTDPEAAKAVLPWLKMARLGNAKTKKGSLRHDRNVIACSGIEGDADKETISLEEAVDIAEKADLGCLIYTSPRHLLAGHGPRWRILCPTSIEITPDQRWHLVSRINGLFRGSLASESWKLSQSYYFGAVNNNPAHNVVIIEGEPIDLLDELDLIAIDQPKVGGWRTGNGAASRRPLAGGEHKPSLLGPTAEPLDVAAALAVIDNDEVDWERWSYIGIAIWAATRGSAAGEAAFLAWSEKIGDDDFDETKTRARWAEITGSPPSGEIGAGTLFHLAREAWPGFEKPSEIRRRRDNDPGDPPPHITGTPGNIEPVPTGPEPAPPKGNGRDPEPEPGSANPNVDPGAGGGDDGGGPEPPQPGDLDPGELGPPEPEEGGDDDGRLTEEKVEEERARIEAVMEEKLATLNRHFAVVNEAGKCIVFKRTRDPAFDNREVLERITFDDFARMYLNRRVEVIVRIVTKKGVEYAISKRKLAPWWLEHGRRRQYLGGVTFDPTNRAPGNFLNLWRGFAVKPAPGDWSLMKNHIVKVICRGEEAHAEYVLNWLARLVQRPEEPGEVALVVRSTEKGTGKSLFGRYIVKLFGHHGMHITHAPHLTGRFNAHLHDCCVLFADEAFFAGDKTHEGALKGLITEYTLVIEGKYRNAITVRNRLHVLIVSNKDWVVPASIDERRWAVFEVLDIYQGDRAYFRAIVEQMESGGLAAMLHELLHRDISGFEVRDVPQTAALQAQKALSLTSLQRWWLAVLARGFLWKSRHGAPWFTDWHDFYSSELLMRSYQQWCDENRPYDRWPREQLGAFFSLLHQPARPSRAHPVYEIDSIAGDPAGKTLDEIAIVTMRDQHGFRVGDLDEARARFCDHQLRDIPAPWAAPDE